VESLLYRLATLSGYLPTRSGATLSLTVALPNEQHAEILEAVVPWSRRQEFAIENLLSIRTLVPGFSMVND
jgi:hypothetical protein